MPTEQLRLDPARTVLPAFAVAFLLQRYLVKGLALGGTKG